MCIHDVSEGELMEDQRWLQWGAIALAAVFSAVLIGIAINRGDDLEGSTWTVEQLDVQGTMTAPLEGTTITASFADGQVSGIASCNNYFGAYEVDGDTITFGPVGTTLMACEPAFSDQEFAYLASLDAADTYAVDGDTMTLSSGGTVLVEYVRADDGGS